MITAVHKIIRNALILILVSAPLLVGQETQFPPRREISRDSILIYARMIIDSAQCRVFVTVDENGRPQAREMSPFPPEDNWVVWLGTFPTSRKVKQIQNNPNVLIFYYDTKGMSYVSVSGKARIVNDPGLKAKYWREGWQQFYPDRKTQYVLIEVTPGHLEVCSFKYNLLWDPQGRPLSTEFEVK